MHPIIFIAWFIFLSTLDVVTTSILLWMDPTAEANPIGFALYQSLGIWGLVLGKVIAVGIVAFSVYNLSIGYRKIIYISGIGVLSLVVINNLIYLYMGVR